jgi:hypothetical protein
MIEKFAAILLLFQSHPASAPLPKFEDFRVNEIFKGTPANPLLETRFARLYRTNIRNAAKEGPNFAGHCTIAEWGCGSKGQPKLLRILQCSIIPTRAMAPQRLSSWRANYRLRVVLLRMDRLAL